jgi:transposase InsO family protein
MNIPHHRGPLTVYSREQIVTRHRAIGPRSGNRDGGGGQDVVHAAVNDATRLAYVEVLADECKAPPPTALCCLQSRGICAERMMTDNGSACRFRRFAKALRHLRIRRTFTRTYTSRTNGKTERFIQTLLSALGLWPLPPDIGSTKRQSAPAA